MAKKDWIIKEIKSDDDKGQEGIINLTLDKSLVVKGCAGSGKSLLALHKAKRVQNEKGNDYCIITFTRALCDYMNNGRIELGLRQRFVTYEKWQRNGKPQYDYIIVDEIQDFTKEEILELAHSARKNFYFFGDTAQSIYEGLKVTLPVERIKDIISIDKEETLFYNYRLPKPVAKITEDYVGVDVEPYGDGSKYKSVENELPHIIQYQNLNEQIKAIARIKTKHSLTDVGILVPTNDIIPIISKMLNDEGVNHEIRYKDKEDWHNSKDTLDFSTQNPKLMTYHSAKGLQFETVFIPQVTDAFAKSARKALYVAMTRTYKSLYVMYSGSMPTPLSDVKDATLYQSTEVQAIKDI